MKMTLFFKCLFEPWKNNFNFNWLTFKLKGPPPCFDCAKTASQTVS